MLSSSRGANGVSSRAPGCAPETMESSPWTFLDTGKRSGAYNMAYDEALARELAQRPGTPTLRFFEWQPWAISLGHHQKTSDLDEGRCKADGIDIVHRPTGGRAIFHAEELTYSVVMAAGRKSILQVYNDISRALIRGLALYGVDAALQKVQPNFSEEYRSPSSVPCFSSSARYEIEWEGRKLVGSAQRRFHAPGRLSCCHGSGGPRADPANADRKDRRSRDDHGEDRRERKAGGLPPPRV